MGRKPVVPFEAYGFTAKDKEEYHRSVRSDPNGKPT
jgi:hypothetical protein